MVHSHDMRCACSKTYLWIAHIRGWLGPTHRGRWRIYEAIDRRIVRSADRILVGSSAAQGEVLYRLQFLGHRVEPYAALATG